MPSSPTLTPSTSATTNPAPPLAVITTTGGGIVVVALELAATPEQRATGLMFREHMDWYAGMLFVFDYDSTHAFWMRNTLIPLDVLYILSNGTVVHVRHQAQPLDETVYYPPVPCRYVLEVNGGFCDAEGVAEGSQVTFAGVG